MSLSPPEYIQIRENLNIHLISNKKSIDPDILEIEILNSKGEVVASTAQEQIGKNKSHENYFRNPFLAHEQKSPFFADAIKREEGTGELQLIFSGILTDKLLDKPLGVLVTKVRGSILMDIFGTQNHKNDMEIFSDHSGEVYIVNGNRLMTANSISSNNVNRLNQKIDTKCILKVLESKEDTFGIYENYRGNRVLVSAMYVPEANWVIVSEKNINDAFLPLTRIKHIFIISGGGALILVLVFAFLISHNINAIIRKLIEGTRRVAEGDLDNPIVIGKRKDEIGELGESFNLMIRELGKTTNENKHLFLQVKRGRDEWLKTFDAITDIITVYDMAFGVVRANKAFFEKFRINTGPLSDKQFYEIICSIDRPWHKSLLLKSVKSLRPESEEIYDSKMGGVFLMTAYPLIVDNVVDLLGSRIKVCGINVSIKDVLPTVFCDRERLADVFTNLIANAIKFVDGELKKIIIGCDHEGDCYKFFVEDRGIGIREEYNEQIFKIFRRLDDIDVEGTGVGLAIVEKIVERHKGKVWVESPVNEGKGSRFCFTLPIKGGIFYSE